MCDLSSSRASVQEEVGPTRKVKGEAGCAAEVHPAHGTLMAEDLNIPEVSWEKCLFMGGGF